MGVCYQFRQSTHDLRAHLAPETQPDIDWITGKVVLNQCPKECSTSQKTAFARKLDKEEASEGWVQALKAWEEKQVEMQKELAISLEEAQKTVPKQYWDYIDVLSKKSSEHMPL